MFYAVNSILLDAVSDYHAAELWRYRAPTIFSEFFLSQTLWLDLRHKTKLHFRGSVINYAFKQSCTTFCQLYIASAPCTLIVTMVLLACVYAC